MPPNLTDPPQPGPEKPSPETFDDPDPGEPSPAFLRITVLALLLAATAFALVIGVLTPDQTGRLAGPAMGAVVAAAAGLALWLGRSNAAVALMSAGGWAVVTGIAVFNGGVRTPAVIAYPLIIVFVGWRFGPRMAMLAMLVSVAAAIGFGLAETVGWLPQPLSTPPAMHVVMQVLVFVLAAALVKHLVRSYQDRLADLRQVSRDLALRTVELEANKAELNRAQAVARVGSWFYDIGQDRMRLSAETCRIFGLPTGTVGNRASYLSRTHPADRATVDRAWQSARQGGSFDHEHRILVGDSIRWVRQMAEFEFVTDGVAVRAVGVTQDITERKLAEDQLELYASVFTHAREGIMIASADGLIIDVNEAFTRITGYARDEVLGRNPRLLNSGRQDGEFYAAMWRSLHERGHWFGEIWNRRKDGEVHALMQTVSAVRDAEGTARHYVALFSDISALKAHESQLERIAHYDVLTGLPNRALLADRLHQAMAQTLRRSQRLAVAFLDLDGFKTVNDEHGHAAGDRLLIALAARMKQALREADTLARIGGDEFVAVLADLDDLDASPQLLTRLLDAVSQPIRLDEGSFQVTASLGVTYYPQAEPVDADQLLRQADQAMYQAKLAGKNRFHVFDPEQDRGLRGRHESLQRMRAALQRHEFVLHYQPKVNLRTGSVVGVEALLRWQHPEQGLLLPQEFLPLIEDHSLAVELGDWVIENALAQVDRWRANGLAMSVSVNVGARQLQQPGFVDRLQRQLEAHPQLRPGDLELEVLETSALEDLDKVAGIIEACGQINVGFALDDFGTGYSSLTYLKRLAVAGIKIDQSFVRDMLDDPDDLAILQGVLGLAAAFRRNVIAEGVESTEQGVLLLQLGCECAQGYAIARPMEAAALPGWVAQWQPDPAWRGLGSASRDELPLLAACVEHRAWTKAMLSHLQGDRLAPPAMDPHSCHFGQWLRGDAGLGPHHRAELQALDALHRQLHELAAELRELLAGNRREQALARADELRDASDTLIARAQALAGAGRR